MLDRCCCFFGRRTSDDDVVSDRDPILLVSGMGGSICNSRNKKSGWQTRVWVRILLADYEFRKKVWSLYNPQTGYTESLDTNTEIVVPEDDYGLFAIDILDPSLFVKLLHLTDVYHFHDMIDMLIGCGYKKGTTLFGYGYDFRQSNRIDKAMDGLKEKLETAYKASGGRKVNLITHSMGGLLVFSKYVNKWITIACPFQGAPGCINDALLTGLQFVEGLESYFFVSRWSMHQLFSFQQKTDVHVARNLASMQKRKKAKNQTGFTVVAMLIECPSIYELLPNQDFNWKKQPEILVWQKESQNEEEPVKLKSYGPAESITLFEGALQNNELKFNGKTIALPFNLSILKWAAVTRQMLNKVLLPEGISFYNIYGTTCDTPFDVCYGSETSPIKELPEVCHTLPQYSYVDGDGTVPAESAMADGFAAVERAGVSGTHRGLLRNEKVFQHIRKWLGIEEKCRTQSTSSRVRNVCSD